MRLAGTLAAALVVASATSVTAQEVIKKKSEEVAVRFASAAPVGTAVVPVAQPVTRTAKPVPVRARPVAPSLVARINLSAQRMVVTSNGRVVGNWKISSGKSGHETPPGRFRPKWSSKMHYSRKYYNSPMPYSVFFNGGIATHGTSHLSRLGQPASHGCIRLRTPNARQFYNLVHRHGYKRTRIVVTGHARQTRTARRSSSRSTNSWRRSQVRRNTFAAPTSRQRNAFGGPKMSGRRYTVNQYNRVRLQRRARSRRMVFPGDAW